LRVVILGTGTDVGKTYVTACLARGLRERGVGALVALKPIESGVEPGADGDAGTIAAAAGHMAVLSPWRFRAALSPHLAARQESVELDVAELTGWVSSEERRWGAELSLVELAGGAFTPLSFGVTNVDLAVALEPAVWLLVAPDSLGVLHDLTSTLRALPQAPDAVLLSAARAPDQSSGGNAAELARLGIAQVLEVIAAGAQRSNSAVEWLLSHPTYRSTQK
jgi:dethiobiotin synthetase